MSRMKFLRTIIAFMMIMAITVQFAYKENCVNNISVKAETVSDEIYNYGDSYVEFLENITESQDAQQSIEVIASKLNPNTDTNAVLKEYDGSITALDWHSGKGEINLTVNVPNDAFYVLEINYLSLNRTASEIMFGIKIDGEYPYSELEDVKLSTLWTNKNKDFTTDFYGNELTPTQVMVDGFVSSKIKDYTGVQIDPLKIFLKKGNHTLSIVGKGSAVSIKSIGLIPPEQIEAYSDVNAQDKVETKIITLQGEKANIKNCYALVPKSDTASSSITPSSPKVSLLNYIGGTSWQYPGDELVWDFEIEKSGYYKFGFIYKQSYAINRTSYRWLKIDGKTPFEEAKAIPFKYGLSWDLVKLSNKKDCYIWLDEGKHTVSLEATLGERTAKYYKELQKIVEELNDIYLEIIKITGTTPDLNRDYELFNQIPDFNTRLDGCHKALNDLAKEIDSTDKGDTNEIVASLENMARILNNMIKNPYSAHDYVSDYYSAYSSLSTWLFDMKKMPLAIDEIQIVPNGQDFIEKKSSVFEVISFRLLAFINSFFKDYSSISGDRTGKDTISVWVGWGKDQAAALDTMIKEDFSEKTGINVDLKIVSSSLINGIISGRYPDIQLSLSRTDPVNFGMRGALYDLKQFEDYDEVITRFQKGADLPYFHNGKSYALPETQTFFTLFYRTDILDKLGLSVPKNWDEFIEVSAIIQRNNMEVYIPYTQIASTAVVNQGIGNLHLLPTLMLQENLSFYNENSTGTALNNVEAINVIDNWIKLYTDYKYVKEADFYNRFRTGIMPLGIVPYNMIFNIVEMAPEVQGKWALAEVPTNNNGNGTVAGGGSGSVIVKKSNKKQQAWEFLKWWTSADVQYEYSRRVESVLGLVGRITTANVEALKKMEWDTETIDVLLKQWNKVAEIPEIPGSYYLIRSVDQIYWTVVNGEMNCMDSIAYWANVADDEIARKQQEYGKVG